ncbi:MAG: acyl carrier protein [Ignavibacteria bacterium]|jgi:acyl carrier protein|nr:acyl carrier protein [Ignavibacteria bacterium]
MDTKEITQHVIKIVVNKLGVEESQVTPEASFTKDLGADSLDTVEVMLEIEKEFNISIDEADQEKVQTVGNVIEYLEKKLG